MPFVTAGDPDLQFTADVIRELDRRGCTLCEVGIPYSDPIADGPVIQAAAKRALDAGVRTGDCLGMIARFRTRHPKVPVGILTYANIVGARGIERFAGELADAGADSLLVADVPSIEAAPYAAAARAAGIDLVLIAAPNTPKPTIERIARLGSGFTYCVARPGVTGADQTLTLDHKALFAALADAGAAPPVLGFGIGRPEHVAEALAHGAAGAISGSALVERVARGASPAALARYVADLNAATVLDLAPAAL
jgi:tryptophan synthase alpha chain